MSKMSRVKVILTAVLVFLGAAFTTVFAVESEDVHPSYREDGGNVEVEDPIARDPYHYGVLWVEGTTPDAPKDSVTTRICYCDFTLRVKGTTKNLIPADFKNVKKWDHAGGEMGLASDPELRNLVLKRITDPGVWGESKEVPPNSSSKASLCVTIKGSRKHSHAWILGDMFNLVSLKDVPPGAILEASVMVKIEGPAAARIGFDFYDKPDSRIARRRAINGRILRGTRDWTLLELRR